MNKISGKLCISIILVIIIMFASSWFFQAVLLEKYFTDQRAMVMEEEIRIVSSMIQNNATSYQIINEIVNFGSISRCLVIVLDENLNIKYTSATKLKTTDSLIQNIVQYIKKEIKTQLQAHQTFHLFKAQFDKNYDYSLVMEIPVDDAKKGYVVIHTFIDSIQETTAFLKRQLMIIGLLSLIIGSIIAFLLANKISKPVLEINKASKRIAEGDFDTTIHVNSKDEIGMLATNINYMASQLKQKDNLKKKFISNISHELKSPISSIRAYGELLLDCDSIEKKEKDKYAEIIIMNSKKLTTMVEDLLELSELQSGYYVLELSEFSLIALIREITDDMQSLAAEKSVQIILGTFHDLLFITADKSKIYSAFYNLLHNAVRHSHLNGTIEITFTDAGPDIQISIIDDGEGIAEDKLPYVWNRFYKDVKPKNKGRSGTGLGMAIVKEIFELHRYIYGIESQIDTGTKVWFNIPKQNTNN